MQHKVNQCAANSAQTGIHRLHASLYLSEHDEVLFSIGATQVGHEQTARHARMT